jgi:hypothetical protein
VQRTFSTLFLFACIAGSILGVVNVYGDHGAVQKLAEAAACEGAKKPCRAELRQLSKHAIWMDFVLQVRRRTIAVRCQRAYYLVGDYGCRASSAGAAAVR